jgi:hypothetical protein
MPTPMVNAAVNPIREIFCSIYLGRKPNIKAKQNIETDSVQGKVMKSYQSESNMV